MKRFEFIQRQALSLLLIAALIPQLAACGTILYPERQGQRSGELDLAVVLMDAVGLLFFIIPGVVAFAVDFHTGAIYLSPGDPRNRKNKKAVTGTEKLNVVHVDPRKLTAYNISTIVSEKTGTVVRLNDPSMIIRKADGSLNIKAQVEKFFKTKTTFAIQ